MAEDEQTQEHDEEELLSLDEKVGVSGGGLKAGRLPRWTRQEILVLIQGKKVAENRVRRGRGAALALGGGVEPKWATVSSYCKKHGANRGAVQCRKRWSNLAGDFKKIKEWESGIKDESNSFWLMRNDVRRERKLPGFFDREVYDILDNNNTQSQKPEAATDGGRSATLEDGLFSEQGDKKTVEEDKGRRSPSPSPSPSPPTPTTLPAPAPISEMQYQPFTTQRQQQPTTHPGQPFTTQQQQQPTTHPGQPFTTQQQQQQTTHPGASEKQPALNLEKGSTSQQGRKRGRFLTEIDAEESRDEGSLGLQSQLVDVLERNARILSDQLEAQNMNLKLDREERNDHAASLVVVLNKLADALGRIADKL